jgi:hypothetical protein
MRFDGTTLNITGSTNITGNLVVGSDGAGDLTVNGAFTAESKSFDIPHPTKEGFRLRYGVLEGPEHGVYLRGIANTNVIELPDYWTGLVHQDSITVQLTPIGDDTIYFLVKIENNKLVIGSNSGKFNVSYFIQAERKDVERPTIEYKA